MINKREINTLIIGSGISGLAQAKCCNDYGIDYLIVERTANFGGLWKFRPNQPYGVTSFTHINVSKQNYSFSDFPMPEHYPDFCHHQDLYEYIKSYVHHHNLESRIIFKTEVILLEEEEKKWKVHLQPVTLQNGEWLKNGETSIIIAKNVSVCSGHHASANHVTFPDQNIFQNEIIHSQSYKNALYNNFLNQEVLIVGIGNSAVDTAVDLATRGQNKVTISTRSGAWIFPTYLFGRPSDHFASRLLLKWLPKWLMNFCVECIVSLLVGHPNWWGLNPKNRIRESQPTVSSTIIHHIQQRRISIAGNIKKFTKTGVIFADGDERNFDAVIMCTGFKIECPFLDAKIKSEAFGNIRSANSVNLYKNVFIPRVGNSLAFIGFAQPASGGLLQISEIQGRWFCEHIVGNLMLPSVREMSDSCEEYFNQQMTKYSGSDRHTIQTDPIIYCDDIASEFGAAPTIFSNPKLAVKLMCTSGGAAQYRLQGPHAWPGAKAEVEKLPVAGLMKGVLCILLLLAVAIPYCALL